jgi:hypothetical protein
MQVKIGGCFYPFDLFAGHYGERVEKFDQTAGMSLAARFHGF